MTFRVEFSHPGQPFCQVGSDFDDFEAASRFFQYSVRGTEWRGTVRLSDSDGVVIESVTAGDDS